MAFTEFYMQTTGNDMNAGSTTADAASVTSVNGSWDITADTFIATAATPFSAVNVGDYASIYNDGVTSGAVYVSQVTAINNGGLSITLSTTIKYGTKPASGATGKSCKMGGAWASLAVMTSLFAAGTVPQSTRVNQKAGTYANTTTGRTLVTNGATTTPFWWRGYNTTPGDRDTDPTLTPPRITFTTGLMTFSGSQLRISHLDIAGANTGRQVATTGTLGTYSRCRFENTNAAAGSIALQNTSSGSNTFELCWFKATTTATQVFQDTVACHFIRCVYVGGLVGMTTSVAIQLVDCIFRAQASHGLQVTAAASMFVKGCTFRGCAGDGIRLDAAPTALSLIADCLFASITGTGINNNSGTNTNVVRRLGNDFYACGANEAGFGDSPAIAQLTDSADPNVSSTNLYLVSGSAALNNAVSGPYENEPYISYESAGAVQNPQGPIAQSRSLQGVGTW